MTAVVAGHLRDAARWLISGALVLAYIRTGRRNSEIRLLQWKQTGLANARARLLDVRGLIGTAETRDATPPTLEEKMKAWIREKGHDMGDVLWPLRVALTGREESPSPFEVMDVLGKEETIKRLDAAIEKLSNFSI